jgi:hypothetical protein
MFTNWTDLMRPWAGSVCGPGRLSRCASYVHQPQTNSCLASHPSTWRNFNGNVICLKSQVATSLSCSPTGGAAVHPSRSYRLAARASASLLHGSTVIIAATSQPHRQNRMSHHTGSCLRDHVTASRARYTARCQTRSMHWLAQQIWEESSFAVFWARRTRRTPCTISKIYLNIILSSTARSH